MEVIRQTFEELRRSMIREGREYGAYARGEELKRAMPEPVVEGRSSIAQESIAAMLEQYRLQQLVVRLRLPKDMSWQQFFDRKEEEIHPWVW